MVSPSINQNRVVADPKLADVLDLFKTDIFLSLNCHAIGTIQSFDETKQTVSATINYQKTFFRSDANGVYTPYLIDYPVLIDCPLVFPQGGDAALTMPVSMGDTCLILFNDRDMDKWFSSGQIGPVNTRRLHSFADAMAFVGLRSGTDPISDYDPSRAVLRNGAAMVGVGEELIKISNEVTSLKAVINGLIDIVTTLTTAMSAATPATVVAAIATPSATATAALTLYKTAVVGALLE